VSTAFDELIGAARGNSTESHASSVTYDRQISKRRTRSIRDQIATAEPVSVKIGGRDTLTLQDRPIAFTAGLQAWLDSWLTPAPVRTTVSGRALIRAAEGRHAPPSL